MNATSRLCVATFGESLDWVKATGLEACIYDATRTREGLIPVPNFAREASQYLHHIVTHYGNFRDYELFLQGDPIPHNPGIMTILRNQPWIGKRVTTLGRRVQRHDPTSGHPHTAAALRFAVDIGVKLDESTTWTVGAMFAASRESLESRPLEWWDRLRGKVIIERETSPWAIERLWLEMLM